MKKRIVFIIALFLGLTGFNGESRIIEQNSVNFQERVALVGYAPQIVRPLKDLIAPEGSSITFVATVSLSDCLAVWYKNGEILPVGGRFQFYMKKKYCKIDNSRCISRRCWSVCGEISKQIWRGYIDGATIC